MDILSYLTPVDVDSLEFVGYSEDPHLLLNFVHFLSKENSDWTDADFAILGVPETRNAFNNPNASLAPDEIRRQFYQLYCWDRDVKIIDLGNLNIGETVEDTYRIMADIIAEMIETGVIPIILGGSNDLAYANYLAYAQLQRIVNVVSVDARFDIGREDSPLKSNSHLSKIILQQPNFLYNFANVGYQSYMNSPEEMHLMDKLYFEAYRVGMLRQDISEVEPVVRNAEMISMDVSSIRHPDAPGNPNSSVNGFYGEEICQVAMYAGMSDKLSSFGFYEYDPMLDYNGQTAQLIAHILWYLVEGFLTRQDDLSFKDKNSYTKYSVSVSENVDEMVFYCSKKTGRWWVVVPIINVEKQTQQNYFLPCSLNDYKAACNDRISERWWRAFNKFNR